MVRYKGYSGTVQVVQCYSAEGTVVQCRGYSGTVQGVQWYSKEGAVVWYRVAGTDTWAQAELGILD